MVIDHNSREEGESFPNSGIKIIPFINNSSSFINRKLHSDDTNVVNLKGNYTLSKRICQERYHSVRH